MAASSRDPPFIATLLARLEIPDCGCEFRRIPCHCDEYQRTGDCRHPPCYPPPCRHILARLHQTTLEDWQLMLFLAHPHAYGRHDREDVPSEKLQHLAIVQLMCDRREAGYSLWNEHDLHQRQPREEAIVIGTEAHHTPNGQPDKRNARLVRAMKGGRP